MLSRLKWIAPCAALLASTASLAAVQSAVMTFESKTLTSEGVEKQTRFQERFIRDDKVVWTNRLLPVGTPPHTHQAGEHQHKHDTNFVLAAKWITINAKGESNLRFVRAENKTIISPRVNEYASLGFDGSWEHAAYLLDRNALKKMNVLKRAAPTGSTWYERTNDTQYTRVLWDEKQQLPRLIESGTIDGLMFNKITIEPRPAPKRMPWQELAGYRDIAYEDLLD
jgi:hypothetical protein